MHTPSIALRSPHLPRGHGSPSVEPLFPPVVTSHMADRTHSSVLVAGWGVGCSSLPRSGGRVQKRGTALASVHAVSFGKRSQTPRVRHLPTALSYHQAEGWGKPREGTSHPLEACAGLSTLSKPRAQRLVRWACRTGAFSARPHQDLRIKGLDFRWGSPWGSQARPHSPARPPEAALYAACTQ